MYRLFLRTILLLCLLATGVQAAGKDYRVAISVTDKSSREPIIMATCVLNTTGAIAVTDADGKAVIAHIPEGRYTLTIRYVGYETIETQLEVQRDMQLSYQMIESSLGLKEVKVVARQKSSGASTTSVIGRQAIDHLQATSLADVMQLLPGQLMGNASMTSKHNLQLRTLVNNNTSAFGASVVLDGMPMSNNGMLSQGSFSATAFTGTDLRQVAADNIDHVEVVRGIPSAEYGDLTSGLVIVHSKTGVTPYQLKAKITPELQNYSLGKGFSLGRAGIVNLSFDYAKAWGDPRQKTQSYGRYTLNTSYAYDISQRWHTTTRLRMMQGHDWTGKDPDAADDGTYTSNRNTMVSLSHNGRISVDRPFMRTLTYTLGLSMSRNNNRASSYVSNPTGLLPVLTARTTGYHTVPFLTSSYLATGITNSQPGNVYAKVSNVFFVRSGRLIQSFKTGAEYSYDWNSGRGYYNGDEARPYRPNSNGRPRAFSSVPGLHSVAAYAEDQIDWQLNTVNRLRINLGLRFAALQPFSDLAGTALNPRINTSFSLTRWLNVRAGLGLSSKMPGLDYLYPDKKYDDRVAANYMPQNDEVGRLLVYHTQVYDVQRSIGLKNATTTKIEVGLDARLPHGGKLSLLAYRDYTPNGFGTQTEYTSYYSDVFTSASGLHITTGQPTTIDYARPARHDLVFMTTGRMGNTSVTRNKGIEIDCDFGEIRPLHTTIYLSGAYQETKTWSKDLVTASPVSNLLPAELNAYGIIPFKVVYPSALDHNTYRRFLNTLRTVTAIPQLKMVASLTAQAIWYDWHHGYTADKQPTGWIDGQLVQHTVTPDMLQGYLDMDGRYSATPPTGQPYILINDMALRYTDSEPLRNPITWNLSARLTKQMGRIGSLSLYVNNSLYYEPYLRSSKTKTLSQRNTSSFAFGAELDITL